MRTACVVVLAVLAGAAARKLRTAPDVAAQVAKEAQENIQIHDQFQDQEQKDIVQEKQVKSNKNLNALQLAEGRWVVALDRDLKTEMLIQVKHQQPAIKDPCGGISCGGLTCPAGFTAESFEGHCCPYCVNP